MKFSDLIGQDKALEYLRKFGHKLPATLLFQGPDGVGKKTAAILLTQRLLCENPLMTGEHCNECSSCVRVEKMVHPNFHFLRPDGTSHKIETVRTLLKEVAFKPYEEGACVIVIDEAEKLTESAANALLKTLEEPPDSVLFILMSSAPGLLPATILSRCQKVSFQPLSEKLIQKLLISEGCDPQEAAVLAEASEGSLGTATSLREILKDETLSLSGFFKKFPRLSDREMSVWVERFSRDLPTTQSFLLLLRHHLRDKIISGECSSERWAALDEADRGLRGHSPRNLTLEVLLHQLSV
ncbi:MAG: DNA polymerase III subunit delta' [bacterium]|nr:DNA polymerase III subunit delta' [bacterium]